MVARDTIKPHEFRVPYRDVDMHGEMFRSSYVVRAEEALTEFWQRRKPQKNDPIFKVTKITCIYHMPLRAGDVVHTHVGVSKIGMKSAGFMVHMMRADHPVAEAEIVWTAHDPDRGVPIPLPEDLRDWFYQFLD